MFEQFALIVGNFEALGCLDQHTCRYRLARRGLLHANLFRAVKESGAEGMSHDDLAERILTATGLPFDAYAADVTVRFQAKRDTEIVMRNSGVLIKFRLYRL